MSAIVAVYYLDYEPSEVSDDSVGVSYEIPVADFDEADRAVLQIITAGYFRIDWPVSDPDNGPFREIIPLHRILQFAIYEKDKEVE